MLSIYIVVYFHLLKIELTPPHLPVLVNGCIINLIKWIKRASPRWMKSRCANLRNMSNLRNMNHLTLEKGSQSKINYSTSVGKAGSKEISKIRSDLNRMKGPQWLHLLVSIAVKLITAVNVFAMAPGAIQLAWVRRQGPPIVKVRLMLFSGDKQVHSFS